MKLCSGKRKLKRSSAGGPLIHATTRKTLIITKWMADCQCHFGVGCGHGWGELVKINWWFTGEQYVEILDQVLILVVRAMAVPAPHIIRLVHDNGSIHTSNTMNNNDYAQECTNRKHLTRTEVVPFCRAPRYLSHTITYTRIPAPLCRAHPTGPRYSRHKNIVYSECHNTLPPTNFSRENPPRHKQSKTTLLVSLI